MDASLRTAMARLAEIGSEPPGPEPAFLGWPGPEREDVAATVADPWSELPAARGGDVDLAYLSLHEAADLLRKGDVSPVELCRVALDRIAAHDPELGAFITVTADRALEGAAAAEREIARGDHRGPLHGIPISLKDVVATAGVLTTSGSQLHAARVPAVDASAWAALSAAGAVLVGKNNLMEFAYSSSVTNERWGTTRNPWDLERTSNGSSSGSAVAVAVGMSWASVCSETGASIQRPASFCGVVGLKPTYGRVSRAGVSPTSWSMDHVGVITRSVLDAAMMLEVLAGADPADPTTAAQPTDRWSAAIDPCDALAGARIGVPRRHIDGHVDEEVGVAFWAAIADCRAAGARIVEIDPRELEYAGTTSVTIRSAEASAHHARTLRLDPTGYSEALRRQLERGLAISAEEYLLAQRARRAIGDAVAAVFADVDVIAAPTTPTAATLIEDGMAALGDRPWEIGAHQYNLARVFSLIGLPVVSLPSGYTPTGLPTSIQLAGPRWGERALLRLAHDYEQQTRWWRPPPRYAGEGS